MGFVDRFERKLEDTVGDTFARVFGGSIVPQEVESLLRREADAGAQEIHGGRILAPNDYIITLSVPDYRKVSADPDITSTTFAKHLEGYIHEQGWQTYGDVVVRFEQSPTLHTGQFRARGAVNPDTTTGEPAPPPRELSSNAEPGVPMTDNPSYRGQGQGRPGDEYYDERYNRPEDPRGPYPPAEQGGYPPQGEPNYPPRGGYPDQGGYPEQAGYPEQGGYPPPSYEQRPPAGYGPPPGGYPDQGYRQAPAGYGHLLPVASPATAPLRQPPPMTTTMAVRRAGRKKAATRLRVARRTRTRAATPSTAAIRIREVTARKAASPTVGRITLSPTTGATARRRPVGPGMPIRATPSQRVTVPADTAPPAMAPARATTRRPVRRSPCSSTTAAAAPTSCARAPT